MSDSQDYFTPESSNRASSMHSVPVSVPPLNKTIRRPRLNEKVIRNLVARRYGSLHDFSRVVARWCDISRATGLH